MLTARQDIRVLIIDDDEDDFFIISDLFREMEGNRFIIDWCNNYHTAISSIHSRAYDIYFVDYRLGPHTGLDLLREVCHGDFCEPIVLLTGMGSKDIDITAMQLGATDYLLKEDLNTEKLERCIRYSLDRAYDLRELKARENKYRNLFEKSKDGVFIADSDLIFKDSNPSVAEMLGPGHLELTGRSLYEFLSNSHSVSMIREKLLARKAISDMEVQVANSNGEDRYCLLSLSFLQDFDGNDIVHGILHDISGIKKAEINNLQTQKLAANERLMRTLAHEIRNPLNNISLSIDHFTAPFEDPEVQKNLVGIIQRNCVRINHIITELLDLTRAPELSFQEYVLQEMVDDSLTMTMDRINLQNITLNRDFYEKPLLVKANRAKLNIAFTNILVNAIEAMEAGKGQLEVKVSSDESGYLVTITDNGIGIPQEYLPKLFEPFFTLKPNGVGLGLASSYSIFQSHNATVKVQSQPRMGTKFFINFATPVLT